jgi:hypothetical protein
MPMTEYMHEAHLANIVTSWCTCMAGLMPMIFWFITKKQPVRWFFAYCCILLTGIPTVWMHALEMQEGLKAAAFFDTGSNVFLAWALLIAVSGDFMRPRRRAFLLTVVTAFNILAWGWMFSEIFGERRPVIEFGGYGHFYAGELALILNAFIVTGVMVRFHKRVPAAAKPFLWLIVGMFLCGLFLASATNEHISFYVLPWHAAWHILGAFAFITWFFFNHVRFTELPEEALQRLRLAEEENPGACRRPAAAP